jgi:phosphoserine phosphatase
VLAMIPEGKSNKKDLEQLRNAEKKFQSFLQRRNELNDLAKMLREERDMINNSHKDIKENMELLKQERNDLVTKMKYHKKIRNQLQAQAKELIKARQKKQGEVFKNLPLRVEELKADVQMLEYRQETVPMSSNEENELIDKIREKKMEYDHIMKKMKDQQTIQIDISDKDNAIDELFKKADEEHEKVQKYYDESQKKHDEYVKMVHELSISIAEANKKHEQYIETRNEAQSNHEKAMEMRSKIISVKDERRQQWRDAKKMIKEQNLQARKAVMDKDKLHEISEKSLESLKKGEKISL